MAAPQTPASMRRMPPAPADDGLNTTSGAANGGSFADPRFPPRCPRLMIKVLSHDEGGKEIIVLCDPEFSLLESSGAEAAAAAASVSSPARFLNSSGALALSSSNSAVVSVSHHTGDTRRLVERVGAAVGSGSRRSVAAAAMLNGVKQHLLLPAANAVTVRELQEALATSREAPSESSGAGGVAGSPSSPALATAPLLTRIPVERQLLRFEGRTISVAGAPASSQRSVTVADALSVFDSGSVVGSSGASAILHRTVHLYDGGLVQGEALRQQTTLALDVGSVLGAPRWVPPVYEPQPASSSPLRMLEAPAPPSVQPQLLLQQQQQWAPSTAVPPPAVLTLSAARMRTPPVSPARRHNPASEADHQRVLRNVAAAEELVAATVAAETERLGTAATLEALTDRNLRSPEVNRAVAALQRARAEAEARVRGHALRISGEDQLRAELEELRQQQRQLALEQQQQRQLVVAAASAPAWAASNEHSLRRDAATSPQQQQLQVQPPNQRPLSPPQQQQHSLRAPASPTVNTASYHVGRHAILPSEAQLRYEQRFGRGAPAAVEAPGFAPRLPPPAPSPPTAHAPPSYALPDYTRQHSVLQQQAAAAHAASQMHHVQRHPSMPALSAPDASAPQPFRPPSTRASPAAADPLVLGRYYSPGPASRHASADHMERLKSAVRDAISGV